MDTPAADIDVDAALVARLLAAQHPDLAGPLALVASGWDNVIYRLGDRLAIRLPRRRVAADLVAKEQHWLPDFAERLAVAVPTPVRRGRPSADYPYPWSIVTWFDGVCADLVPVVDRCSIAVELADFVAGVHMAVDTKRDGRDVGLLPYNPVRGVPLHSRSADVLDRIERGLVPHADGLRALWQRLVRTPGYASVPRWLHGDLHPGNLLVSTNEPRRLTAVLDFGDLTVGDPATDLAAAWLVFDRAGRSAFHRRLDELGHLDADTWHRARGWALSTGTALAALSDDNPRMADIGRHALVQVLDGDE